MPKARETGQLRRLMFNGHRASVWEDEKFWRPIKMMSANKCDCTYCYKTIYFKTIRDFPGGPVAKTQCSQHKGTLAQLLVGKLDPTCQGSQK